MTTLGRHPDRLLVKLTLGDGATLIATNADGWAGPVTLGYGGPTGEPVIVDTATVAGTTATWTLTEAQVTDRAAHDWARLEDNGLTVAAGRVIDVAGWQGATQSQTIAAVQSGPPGPTVISSDPGNVATLGTDGFIFVEPGAGTVASVNGETGIVVLDAADVGAATAAQGAKADTAVQPADLTPYATDADLSGHASDTTGVHGIADTAALVVTTDPRLSDARTPTAHTHDDRYFTEAEVTASLAGKANTAHNHAAADITSGTLAVARLGSGTPAAGKYVDGGTGAWTTLPTGGGGAVDSVNGETGVVVLSAADVGAAPAAAAIPAGGTDGQVLTKTSGTDYATAWETPSGGDPWTYSVATTTTTNSSVTPVNIAGLSVPALPDGLYEVEGIAIGYGPSNTEGVQVGMAASPSGARVSFWAIGPVSSPSATVIAALFPRVNVSTASLGNSGGAANASEFIIAARFGMLIRATSMAAAVNLTVRPENDTMTVGVLADSFLRYRRIAD